ncbi:MAG: LamG domain-containing protein [Rhodospirillaceae bacterium]|nr:LamG domain-containing protein [Rhodospirillaceae bacterium]MBT6202259.1 LamG domain-containing protein [Rhodospirillaceae bacterium]MBT6510588.1 LamG domain-containing protein [Rhodospirillaceae bacterium]
MKKVLGYTNAWSVAPGDELEVKVSTYGPSTYRADLVRVICGDDDPDHGIYREEMIDAPFAGEYAGRTQEMAAGSYVAVPASDRLGTLASFTVQVWVLPTTPARGEQGLVAHWDEESERGFALFVDGNGAAALRVGDGTGTSTVVACDRPLAARRWHLVAASYDATTGEVELCQDFLGSPFEADSSASAHGKGVFRPATGALLMAALPARPGTSGRPGARHYFNGKLDRPRLAGRVLSRNEREALAWDATPQEREPALVATWDFSRDIGSRLVSDAGFNGLHGMTVNVPSRGVKGFNWSGNEQNWQHAPQEYGAIHFHEDDHYDAGWETDFTYTVPDDLKSGVYAVRLQADDDESFGTFFVRPPRGTATSKLAFLASTVTYMAYANYQWHLHEYFAEVTDLSWTPIGKNDVFLQEHPETGLSTYDTHLDGSGVRYASRLRPVINTAPKTSLEGYNLNLDTLVLGWLETCGIDYDVITDEDLHHEGLTLLERYSAVVTGAHPEYFTTPMWDGLRSYIARGGRLAYLGGNGFIWRCAMSEKMPGVIELRRAEDGIRYRDEEPGEYYHEFNGEYGGLWRRLGMAPQALVGVGTVAVGFDASGVYKRTPASFESCAAFIFEGIGEDEIVGDFGFLGGGASGGEIDAADPLLGTPPHALVVASSQGHSENTWLVPDETGFHHSAMDGAQNPRVKADMTFFETPAGGAVFSVGSIAWSASLPHNAYDNNVAQISENVLRRFLDPEPFTMLK